MIFSCLTGYVDVINADRLSRDPAMRQLLCRRVRKSRAHLRPRPATTLKVDNSKSRLSVNRPSG
ncbi:MAG: hypothetical protein ACJAVR_003047 [Paracoccaceae bacterium]|jgi:hypothetical protein